MQLWENATVVVNPQDGEGEDFVYGVKISWGVYA